MTVIYELSENALRAKESWRFRNEGGALIAADKFKLNLPENARRIVLDEDSKPFEIKDQSIYHAAPLPVGELNLGIAYELPLDGDTALTLRNFPFSLGGARIISENLPGIEFTSSVQASKRTRDLNGIIFAIWDLGGVKPGQTLELKLSGLPTRGTLLRDLTIVCIIFILIWMTWALRQAAPSTDEMLIDTPRSIMSAGARKTRLLQALEVLDQDLASATIDEKQYTRRQKALLKELATTMRSCQLEEGSSA